MCPIVAQAVGAVLGPPPTTRRDIELCGCSQLRGYSQPMLPFLISATSEPV